MLVNLTPKNTYRTEEERCVKYLNRYHKDDGISGEKWKVRKFSEVCIPTEYTGVFWCTNDGIFSDCKQHQVYGSKSYWNALHRLPRNRLNVIIDYKRNAWYYGVADNLEQIVDLYNKNEEGWFYGNHVVLCHKVTKDPDSPCSGWRWHKWGPYIGTQNPQCEYLNDEPEIDEVIIFSIYKVI